MEVKKKNRKVTFMEVKKKTSKTTENSVTSQLQHFYFLCSSILAHTLPLGPIL